MVINKRVLIKDQKKLFSNAFYQRSFHCSLFFCKRRSINLIQGEYPQILLKLTKESPDNIKI